MTEKDFASRQTHASSHLRERITGWWIEHTPECEEAPEDPCQCGEVAWFAGLTRVIRVDSSFSRELYPMH